MKPGKRDRSEYAEFDSRAVALTLTGDRSDPGEVNRPSAQTVLRYADQRDATTDAEIRSWRRRKSTGRSGG